METFAYVVMALVILAVINAIVNPFKPKEGFFMDRHGNIRCRVCKEEEHRHDASPCPKQQELF